MTAAGRGEQPVRLLFEMSRDDNPRLYDDLVRFNKGTKRVNRLRFLAHEGLMAQQWGLPQASPMQTPPIRQGSSDASLSAARHTNQAFDAPKVEGE